MKVEDALKRKGNRVLSVRPQAHVKAALSEMAQAGVGALMVTNESGKLSGILSERDIVRAIDKHGAGIIDEPVSKIMTSDVRTCTLDEELAHLAQVMTQRRIRHLPVVDNDSLIGLMSIGDVVKARLDELEDDRQTLTDFIYAR